MTPPEQVQADAARRTAVRIDAADLVATIGAEVPLASLYEALGLERVWVALDVPGSITQTLGEALARGAPGPLAALFGPPRDQVIGATFTAANGTVVRTGGRVVKNVAGFDLAKLLVGGHDAFGRLLEVNLRLRALPAADETRAWLGSREEVARACVRLMTGGAMLAAFEVLSPSLSGEVLGDARWGLLARAMGTAVGAGEEQDAAHGLMGRCDALSAPRDAWQRWHRQVSGQAIVARVGADPSAWPEAVALAERHGAAPLCVTVPRGTVRVAFSSGSAGAIQLLRNDAAARGWPLTLERADDATTAEAGVWGALSAGTLRLARALRAALHDGDPSEPAPWNDTAHAGRS